MSWGGGGGGGVPISHNALQHYPEFHGADTWGGGYPARSRWGGPWVPPSRVPPQAMSGWGYPPPRPGQEGGGTQLGQQKEYSLHSGRYASCVHAGGLSCYIVFGNFGKISCQPSRGWGCNKISQEIVDPPLQIQGYWILGMFNAKQVHISGYWINNNRGDDSEVKKDLDLDLGLYFTQANVLETNF